MGKKAKNPADGGSAIRDVEIKTTRTGRVQAVRIVFGPHHFVELVARKSKLSFAVGYTHHGFRVDASEVNGELEQIINELRNAHPERAID
jgi:hypothetical protein